MALRSDGNRVVLFEDETGFSLHPKLGRVWAKKGSRPFVYTQSQHQKRLNIFGWVDLIHGWHGIMKGVRGDTHGFIQMLRKILFRFKGRIIDLWIDNARWHKGAKVAAFIAEYSFFHLHYLPAYHPELNYQERLWHTMRYEETTNVYFETISDLDQCIFKRSQRWKPKKIKYLCQLS
jgi:transposase